MDDDSGDWIGGNDTAIVWQSWKKKFAFLPLIYSPEIVGKYVWGKIVYRRAFGVSADSFYWEYGTLIDVLKDQ